MNLRKLTYHELLEKKRSDRVEKSLTRIKREIYEQKYLREQYLKQLMIRIDDKISEYHLAKSANEFNKVFVLQDEYELLRDEYANYLI
jgi:hypothetical protein